MKSSPSNNPLIGKKILITGGGGFIGSFLAQALSDFAEHIWLMDAQDVQNTTAKEMNLLDKKNINYCSGDIRDKNKLKALPLDFDYIIHAAGILGIKRVAEEPLLTSDVNVFGTRNILDFSLQQKNLKRFILFSTSEIYGPHAEFVNEDSPSVIPNRGMRWVYASGKLFSEYLLKSFIQEYQIPGVIVRPFNVYGPYRKGSNAFTTFVTKALYNQDIFLTGNGQQTRCWCYIDDFVSGILLCLTKDDSVGEAFNLGNPFEPLSMQALADKICLMSESSSKIHILGSQEEDVLDRKPDISKAVKLLNYHPRISLEQGIECVMDWCKNSLPAEALTQTT